MWVPLEHLDVLASDEEISEMAILVADRIHSQMVDPTAELEHASLFSGAPLRRVSLQAGASRRRRFHRRHRSAGDLSLPLELELWNELVLDRSGEKMATD